MTFLTFLMFLRPSWHAKQRGSRLRIITWLEDGVQGKARRDARKDANLFVPATFFFPGRGESFRRELSRNEIVFDTVKGSSSNSVSFL
jgi:hypothetical protein